jgi:hypothetical protein
MPQVPDDLVRLTDIMKEFKPSRGWWDKQIAAGRIQAYKQPGERGLLVSEREARALMQVRPWEPSGEEDAG